MSQKKNSSRVTQNAVKMPKNPMRWLIRWNCLGLYKVGITKLILSQNSGVFFFQKTVWRKELTWEPTEKLMRTCFEKAAIWCGLAKNEFCSNLTLTLPGCLTMWCISNSTLSLQSALKIECPHKKLTSHQKHFNLRLLRMHPQSLNAQNSIFLNDLFYFSTETPKILYQQVFN